MAQKSLPQIAEYLVELAKETEKIIDARIDATQLVNMIKSQGTSLTTTISLAHSILFAYRDNPSKEEAIDLVDEIKSIIFADIHQ